jgi:uncharacterized protein (DUF1697 family)
VRQIVLLRGINVGSRNRIPMGRLRGILAEAGFADVETHLQSGNVVLESDLAPDKLAARCKRLIADEFGLDIDVVVRTRDELAAVVARNPLADVADNPKRYQVSFLSEELKRDAIEELSALAADGERLVATGRELYGWHPDGIGRSKLWAALASPRLGVTATARNWSTVTKLLAIADRESR